MNTNVKRATVVLAMTPVMSLPAVALAASLPGLHATTQTAPARTATATTPTTTRSTTTTTTTTAQTTTTTHTDAPKATASAVAAQVGDVVTIGGTSTSAGSDGGSAHAHALDLLGSTVSGGDISNGSSSGALFATGATPLGDLELAPWSGSVTRNGGGTQAQAEAALAHAGLLDVIQLWLLHSQSQSTWTPDASHGHSSSDGAEVNVADALDVKVLHAETDSNGTGSSALLVINGNGIGTSDQTGGGCKLTLDPLAEILCLQASGGKGSGGTSTETAYVAGVTGAVPGTRVTGATSAGGHVAAAPRATRPAPSRARAARHSSASPVARTTAAGRLPFTGGEIGLLTAYGAALAGLGAAILAAARRGRRGRRRSVIA